MTTKMITGTFLDEITWDIPSQNWSRSDWKREFDTMKEAGIDTVIIIRMGLREQAIYPSEVLGIKEGPDFAQLFLDEAHRCNMNLYFASYVDKTSVDFWNEWEGDWEMNKKILPEIMQRYGDHPAFHGWYVASETCIASAGAIEIYSRLSGLMKELAPEKPVLISPYYPSWAYREANREERHRRFVQDWRTVLSHAAKTIDICAFQDGSCTYEMNKSETFELEDYQKEVYELSKEFDLINWTNIESFGRRYHIRFPPIDWRILKRKMEMASPYSEKLITFEFSHFMSPNSMYPSARKLYERYMENIVKKKPY